jgi:hypothetical protein
MKAVSYGRHGSPDVLELTEIDRGRCALWRSAGGAGGPAPPARAACRCWTPAPSQDPDISRKEQEAVFLSKHLRPV